jgi:hypothetical protein
MLRGLGAGIALPLLDAMVPALAQSSAPAAPVRLAWFYLPNGIDMRHFTPASYGPLTAELPRILAPLAPHRADINVISHLTAHWGRPLLAGAGDHGRALAASDRRRNPPATTAPATVAHGPAGPCCAAAAG